MNKQETAWYIEKADAWCQVSVILNIGPSYFVDLIIIPESYMKVLESLSLSMGPSILRHTVF